MFTSALFGGMNVPTQTLVFEPDSEIDMAGRFVPDSGFGHKTMKDGNSLMSECPDIPLQLPASTKSCI